MADEDTTPVPRRSEDAARGVPPPFERRRPDAPWPRIGAGQAAMGIASLVLLAAAIGGVIYLVLASGIGAFERLHAANPGLALGALAIGTVLLVTFAARLPRPLTLADLRLRGVDWHIAAVGAALLVVAARQGGIIRSDNLAMMLIGVACLGIYAATAPFPADLAALRKGNVALLVVSLVLIVAGLYGAIA